MATADQKKRRIASAIAVLTVVVLAIVSIIIVALQPSGPSCKTIQAHFEKMELTDIEALPEEKIQPLCACRKEEREEKGTIQNMKDTGQHVFNRFTGGGEEKEKADREEGIRKLCGERFRDRALKLGKDTWGGLKSLWHSPVDTIVGVFTHIFNPFAYPASVYIFLFLCFGTFCCFWIVPSESRSVEWWTIGLYLLSWLISLVYWFFLTYMSLIADLILLVAGVFFLLSLLVFSRKQAWNWLRSTVTFLFLFLWKRMSFKQAQHQAQQEVFDDSIPRAQVVDPADPNLIVEPASQSGSTDPSAVGSQLDPTPAPLGIRASADRAKLPWLGTRRRN